MSYLYIGCDLLYADAEDALGWRYIQRALEVAERALAECGFETQDRFRGGFPGNRGDAYKARGLARCMLGRDGWERDLFQAASDWERMAEQWHGRWDSMPEEYLLCAVRSLLVGGDPRGALGLFLTHPRGFRFHDTQAACLQGVIAVAGAMDGVDREQTLRRFDDYFDPIRSPHYRPDVFFFGEIARLELGAIRYRYFDSPDGVMDWRAILRMIAR